MKKNNKTIELTNKQYQDLINTVAVANMVYGPMSDLFDDKYDPQADALDALETHLLRFSENFDAEDLVDSRDGESHLSEGKMEEVLDDMTDYDEFAFWDKLAMEMARREFYNTYSIEQISKMSEDDQVMKRFELEDKWHEYFDKNGLEKLEFKK